MRKSKRREAPASTSGAAEPRLYVNGKFYSGDMNGVHRSADRLLRALDACVKTDEQARGWDIRLLLPKDARNVPDFENIRQVHHPMGASQFWEQAILPFLAMDGVLLSLANFGPIIHHRKVTMVHDAQFSISPQSYSRRRRFGYRALIPAGARSSRKVLTVSDYARESLEMFGFAKRARIDVIGNGGEHILERDADPAVLGGLGLGSKPFALMFGSPAIYKNVKVVFEAFNSPAFSGIDLVVIGASRDTLMQADLPIPREAIFAGSIDDPGLRALYEAASCFLYPSRTEGFGLPPLEAMLCGCPVIAAPAGAIPEICRDAILYAGVDHPADWVRQIRRLQDVWLRDAKIAEGLERAAAYSWAASGQALVASLATLLSLPVQSASSRAPETSDDRAADGPPRISIPQVS